MALKVKIESWTLSDGKTIRMAVARDNGRIKSRRPVQGSGISSDQEFKSIYSRNKTLYEDRVRLSNVIERVRTSPVRKNLDKPANPPPENEAQYVVSGVVNGRRISRRSPKLGSPSARSAQEAREYAYNNFYKEVGVILGDGYDANEGFKYQDKVTGLKEGWVYYQDIR